ncbi:MAG: hypothetical protein VKJ64_00140 [Leptolyngbyaceae bacterium]|nr:hypothetical protein [Leptolyngbyaceae bacterium]
MNLIIGISLGLISHGDLSCLPGSDRLQLASCRHDIVHITLLVDG